MKYIKTELQPIWGGVMDRYLISNDIFDYQPPDFERFYLENKPSESQGNYQN